MIIIMIMMIKICGRNRRAKERAWTNIYINVKGGARVPIPNVDM